MALIFESYCAVYIWAHKSKQGLKMDNYFQLGLWVKISATLCYFVSICSSVILVIFVFYERQGMASNYRMLSNQLLSSFYFNMAIASCFCCGIDLFGVWLGELPQKVCQFNVYFKDGLLIMTNLMFFCLMSLTKFMYIVVWKRLKILEDFLARFATI